MTRVTSMAPMPKEGRYSMPLTVLGIFLKGTMNDPLAKPTYSAQRRPVVIRFRELLWEYFPLPARGGRGL
eukprot:scaffold351718_cov34-Prasinocladus_malaysianus.AAC.1